MSSNPKSARSATPPTHQPHDGPERRRPAAPRRPRGQPSAPPRSPTRPRARHRIRHAVCPGAGAATSRPSSSASEPCAPAAGAPPPCTGLRRVVAQPHRRRARAGPVQQRRRHADAAGGQGAAGPNDHAVARGVLGQHVERLGGGHADPPPLPDREGMVAVVATQHRAVAVHHLAARGRRAQSAAAVAAHEGARAGAGQEAQVLALALVGHRQPGGAGQLAHARLGELAHREPQPLQFVGPEPGEHVALVLAGVGAGAHQRALRVAADARVVPGGQRPGPQPRRQRRAWRRSAPGRCSARTGWGWRRRRSRPGSRRPRRRRSAPAGRGSGAGGPSSERVPGRRSRPEASSSCARRRWRGPTTARSVTATTSLPASMASCAAAALSTPPLMATSVRSARGASRGAPSRAASPMARCSASAVRSAAWAAAGERRAQPLRDGRGRDARRVQQRPALHQLDGGAAGGSHGGATAGVEPRLRHAVLLEPHETRTRSPQAAPPAAPEWGDRASAPRPRGASRWSRREGSCVLVRAAMGSA